MSPTRMIANTAPQVIRFSVYVPCSSLNVRGYVFAPALPAHSRLEQPGAPYESWYAPVIQSQNHDRASLGSLASFFDSRKGTPKEDMVSDS